jgi:hypothetical protein
VRANRSALFPPRPSFNVSLSCRYDVQGERSDTSFMLLPSLSQEKIIEFAVAGNSLAAISRSTDNTFYNVLLV